MNKRIPINNQIRAAEVRLIDEDGSQLGVLKLSDALKISLERGRDLIQVTEKVVPPVCKIGDYGKYLYQQEKKGRETKKRPGGDLKEVRLTYTMSPHDIETRAQRAKQFLDKGDRVRVTLPLRGRQKALEGYARGKMKGFLDSLTEQMKISSEGEIKREPRGLSIIINKG
ncbi:MAG: translation initiation factor IF-3 [bacterium]|nr:translation initiation factor IF-3 [bacterium]